MGLHDETLELFARHDLALSTAEQAASDYGDLAAERLEALTAEQEAHADTRGVLNFTQTELFATRDELAQVQGDYAAHLATPHYPAPDDGPDEPPTGPTRDELRAAWNVCVHPNFQSKPAWEDPDEWMAEVADIGHASIRGLFNPSLPNCRRTLELCRHYGITWLMTLAPGDGSVTATQVESRIKYLADNGWGDVVLAFEGPNEPEAAGAATWVATTINVCKAIKRGRDAHLPDKLILSPSMHDVREDNSNGAGYRALAEQNIAALVDRISLHSYPKGDTVLTGFNDRLELARIAYPNTMKVWLTETGWTTYTRRPDGTRGPQPTTEADAAIYGAEAPAIIAAHPVIEKAFRYELRDDPVANMDALMNDERGETRYGTVRPDGSRKPEAIATKAVLNP